ncbi:hypothetical protein NEUTE1DRAFT_35544 [Neurospora tetrasperma FGSC 2508]|uniref:Uncharacterized protein n=1 Tax=Neurospora tetrasperma (strain FGSC 2508 / ATCC MYA-4615 / P0657) TaxID=510951 RepID=F8MBZ8_NEUT8|nr:uncharacterized protein NEUTE1DRAFT_35544 [Neurospora tetrasperma FGSC 2508]EGO61207.1 hypothetical protein NEUTE1DRAFT_35544 [Neurospora tetrasperma FGSC 2508]EGZ74786.1 hypothetical protein NEUTE2DRAFT_58531 [Neurospora tetrasperma FGSC 2509]
MDGNSPQAAALRIGRLSIRTRNHTLAGCNSVQFGRDETVCTYVCHVMIRLYGTVTAPVVSFLQDKATVSQLSYNVNGARLTTSTYLRPRLKWLSLLGNDMGLTIITTTTNADC